MQPVREENWRIHPHQAEQRQKELAQAVILAPLLSWDMVGAALRTQTDRYPLFVSPGHRVDVPGCVQVMMSLTGNYR